MEQPVRNPQHHDGPPAGPQARRRQLRARAAGQESFVYHAHQREEEWIYILSGEGQAEIDDGIYRVRAGDFMAFPTGVAHHLRNCGRDDLVYLCGGEHLNIEIADFPRLGKRMLRRGEQVDIVDIHPERELTPFGA